MALPEPTPGLVIRCDYVWLRDKAAGLTQGKERPACIVAAVDLPSAPNTVVVLPITHSAPDAANAGIEIPPRVRATLGLDDAPCWVIVSEFNADDWPSPGLGTVPGSPGVFAYGMIPPGLFAQIKAVFLERYERGRVRGVRR